MASTPTASSQSQDSAVTEQARPPRRYAFVFVCQAGELEVKALLLAASLRKFLRRSYELIAAIPEPEEVFGRIRASTVTALEALGVRRVPIHNEVDPQYPIANKISCLRVPTDADKLVFLDSDILCLREFHDEPRFQIAFNAKPVDAATFGPSPEAWQPIYALFGLAVPEARVRSTVSGDDMPPYFNAGFIATSEASRLGDLWLESCRTIRAGQPLPCRPRNVDQVSLAVAVLRSGMQFDCLDDGYNYPAHLKPLQPARLPRFCNYHWPSVLRREPVLVQIVQSLLEQRPEVREAMQGMPEWEAVAASTRPRRRWFSPRQRPTLATPDVIITGVPRSGTSYLCNLLHRFDNCVALNEPQEIFAPLMEQLVPWGVATLYRDIRRDILDGRPIRNKLKDGQVVHDTAEVSGRSEYVPSVARPEFVLAMKNTVTFLNRMDSLQRVLPDARIVACIRNPFDTIASWKRSFAHLRAADVASIPVGHVKDPFLTPSQRASLEAVVSMPSLPLRRAAYWRYLAGLVRERMEQVVVVRYPELVRDPTRIVERILRGLSPGRLREPIEASELRTHRIELDDEDIQAILSLCSDVAQDLGVYLEEDTALSATCGRRVVAAAGEPAATAAGPILFRTPGDDGPVVRDVSQEFVWAREDSARRGDEFAQVSAYCMFIGYPQSGHSLVGSLLDAHPDIVIAHELDALGYLEAGFSAAQIYSLILERDRTFTAAGREWSGYSYVVGGQWQGRVRTLRVIGDKKGGASTRRLRDRPELLARLQAAVGIPLKILHVVRNPYDKIATILRRGQQPTLGACIEWYFMLCDTESRVIREIGDNAVKTIRYESLVAQPDRSIEAMCHFLGVECGADYVTCCADLVWKAARKTRSAADWTLVEIGDVARRMKRFPHLAGYEFDG